MRPLWTRTSLVYSASWLWAYDRQGSTLKLCGVWRELTPNLATQYPSAAQPYWLISSPGRECHYDSGVSGQFRTTPRCQTRCESQRHLWPLAPLTQHTLIVGDERKTACSDCLLCVPFHSHFMLSHLSCY